MRTRILAVVAGIAVVGCGEKAQDVKNAANAAQAAAAAAPQIVDNQNEAAKFQEERRSRGDTVAMGYQELQKYLPSAPDGYKADEEPSGSSQSMTGFSMSQAEQTFSKPAPPDGSAPSVQVTLVDFGGTQSAYGIMALPMMMNLSQEDAHRRMTTLKMDTPFTWGTEEFDKDNKDSKVTVVTRYRYLITVEARHHGTDELAMLKRMAEDVARKFEGK
ncbi:MAG: hypothetical protein IPN47_18085 [Gemmatimonadetes bacterium]|nr:hypothetical protein [Gemmatimonadota bacterium]